MSTPDVPLNPYERRVLAALTYIPITDNRSAIAELSAIGAEMCDGDGPLDESARGRLGHMLRAIHDLTVEPAEAA